jgi:GTP cyclohydrolase I
MPDIAGSHTEVEPSALEWVGMEHIELPVEIEGMMVPASLNCFVNLNQAQARGIHMSRLFNLAQEMLATKSLNSENMGNFLRASLESHSGLSDAARLVFNFSAPVRRRALKSPNWGWRQYPIKIAAEMRLGASMVTTIEVAVTYSSTCPASAALARQLIQENFQAQFSAQKQLQYEEVHQWLGKSSGVLATPHAQRSIATVNVTLNSAGNFSFGYLNLIDLIEEALGTPVQTSVKREDEQEFALRNGQNLMFCEDAARRVKQALEARIEIVDFNGVVRHFESLHPHDAVSEFSK